MSHFPDVPVAFESRQLNAEDFWSGIYRMMQSTKLMFLGSEKKLETKECFQYIHHHIRGVPEEPSGSGGHGGCGTSDSSATADIFLSVNCANVLNLSLLLDRYISITAIHLSPLNLWMYSRIHLQAPPTWMPDTLRSTTLQEISWT